MVTFFFSFYLMGGALPQAGGGPFVGVWLGSVQRGVEGETPGWAAFWGPSPPLWRPWLPRTPLTGTFLLFPDEPPERQLRGGLNLQVRAWGAPGACLTWGWGPRCSKGRVRLPGGGGPEGHPEPLGARGGGRVVAPGSFESSTGDVSFGWKLSLEMFSPTVQSWDLVKQYFFSLEQILCLFVCLFSYFKLFLSNLEFGVLLWSRR